jgi:hypothetical protein
MRTSENNPSETVWKFGMGPKSGLRKCPKGVEGVYIGRLLPPRKCRRNAFSYFPNSFSTLDFSHLGIWQSASAKGSVHAPGTFCGSRCARATRNKSQILARRPQPPPRRGRRKHAVPKGRGGPEGWVRKPRVARFGALQASLPRSEQQQDPGASSSPPLARPLARPGDEHTCPAASQWLKSSSTHSGE